LIGAVNALALKTNAASATIVFIFIVKSLWVRSRQWRIEFDSFVLGDFRTFRASIRVKSFGDFRSFGHISMDGHGRLLDRVMLDVQEA
jgi:hypothetical protein